jgi:hypothetical protein
MISDSLYYFSKWIGNTIPMKYTFIICTFYTIYIYFKDETCGNNSVLRKWTIWYGNKDKNLFSYAFYFYNTTTVRKLIKYAINVILVNFCYLFSSSFHSTITFLTTSQLLFLPFKQSSINNYWISCIVQYLIQLEEFTAQANIGRRESYKDFVAVHKFNRIRNFLNIISPITKLCWQVATFSLLIKKSLNTVT